VLKCHARQCKHNDKMGYCELDEKVIDEGGFCEGFEEDKERCTSCGLYLEMKPEYKFYNDLDYTIDIVGKCPVCNI